MLPRPKLTYHPDGHPVLSKRDLERYAIGLIKSHFPARLKDPGPLRPAELIQLAHEQDHVVTVREDLGHDGDCKRLGRMYLTRKIIVLDNVLFSERQVSLPFVIAHELAHWLLHRDCLITSIRQREQFPDDNEAAETEGESDAGWSSLRRIEWQASKLAAAILIPQQAAINSIWALQSRIDIVVRKGVIYENPTPESRVETEQQITHLAETFGVSKTVTRIRLRDLGLFHQQEQRPDWSGTTGDPFAAVSKHMRSQRDV